MRFVLAVVFLAAESLSALAAQVPATSNVESVTVYLSGAEVTRVAKVQIEKGESTIVLGDIPASAIPGSIRVDGKATGKLDIGSVDTARKLLARAASQAADVQRKALEDQIEKLGDQKSAVEAQAQAAETQKALIANLAQLPLHPAPQTAHEAAPAPAPVPSPVPGAAPAAAPDWPRVLALIVQATADAGKLALDAQQKIRDIDRRIHDLESELASLAPPKTEQTEVAIHVVAQSPLDADLSIRYQVPDARWAPIYDARLQTGSKTEPPKLTLAHRAAISQRSGESWDSVSLQLSTARPSDGSSVPPLDTQVVDYEPEVKPVAMPAPSFDMMAKSSRAMVAEDSLGAGGGGGAAAPEAAPSPIEESVAALESAPFEATFDVPGRVTVVGNGDVKRVLLTTEDIEPTLTSRAVPKLDSNAYLYAKIKIAKGTPLLPGRVYLFRDGTYVGTGDMLLLPLGENHDLGFGIDDQVKVKHAVLEEKRGETGLISTSHVDSRNFRVTVKNLHERPIDVTILDRVPVSQNDEIKVEYTGRVSPTTQNVEDKRGVIAFDARLEPDEEKILEYGYRISWPASKSIVYGP